LRLEGYPAGWSRQKKSMRFFIKAPGFKNIGQGNILRNKFSKDKKESKKLENNIFII
jgi:hypothetical protein